MAIAGDGVKELLFRHDAGEGIAHSREDDVPQTCTNGGVEDKVGEAHLGQTCGDRDEVANAGNEATDKGGYSSMIGKILFGVLHFLLVEKAEMAECAIGKSIDYWAPQVAGCGIVDECPDISSEGGAEDDENHIQVAILSSCAISCRRHDEFAWNRDNGALERHKECDGPIVEMVEAPSDER